ncbi:MULTISPECIES: helix-turn-helix transcriptional regulator [Streptomyces]|uniref:helix-turn-helix transcriptional regulator n=1 Tax=Streptomyces TaxID=1883 RepID=UPI002D21A325|nr:helix-turn-helix domain-containing protein [Streptomyces rimosus]
MEPDGREQRRVPKPRRRCPPSSQRLKASVTANSLSSPPAAVSVLGPTGAAQRAFLNLKEAAEYLGLSPNTLYVWRHRRQGPPSFRMGARGRVMYRLEALDAWVREQELADSRSNTSLSPVSAPPASRPSGATGT